MPSYNPKLRLFVISLLLLNLMTACKQFSEEIRDPEAGMNGGFEISKNGLPVNWLMYTPKTVPDSKFEIVLDTREFKEGKQSLRFDVQDCTSMGGWGSPGFTNQYDADQESTYDLSFWIKNDGSEFRIMAGGVSAMNGDMKTLLQTREQIDDWTRYAYEIPIAKEYDQLRIELNILQPGKFWIDDIKIKKQ